MKRFIVGFIPLSFMVGLPAIAGRMACVLAAALLACASSSHSQVIEEGGFPVKGGDNSGEPFSLSCPPRLVAQAGESVLFSCTVRGVPEEGVRYEWEPVSGDGLHLLSDASERSPLFTAPLSEAGAEYVYRLTAMSVGVYETATVTVSVEGVPEETVSAPVVREECDSLVDFEGGREGCVPWEKAPPRDPFGGIPDDEGIVPWPSFPESPGAEEKEFPGSSGGGSFPRTPPRLECPVAVFLEELETGAIECHAWDASGEEYLEYSWEPVGSTTRDYLDNPRLIPEDSPTPSVVAPETPAYETLESFRSGETTSLYRYRLTATSRATGLSSSSEVEVYVSSSRPGVYCPLEVVVEEGETIALDCEGVDPLSHRMDYDEESASVLWEWEGLWATSTAPLAAKDLSSPLFTAPAGSAGKEYHYIASMTSSASGVPRTARRRVTVRVVGEEDTEQALAPASRANAPSVTCEDAEIYEAAEDFTLDCSVTDEPDGAAYMWTARGSTSDTNDLANTDSLRATFSVPENVDANTDYEYRVTMTVSGVEQARDDITITVKKKGAIACDGKTGMGHHGGIYYGTFESGRTVQLDVCSTITGAGPFSYSWWGYYLSNKDQRVATFTPPDNVGKNTVYRYALTISSPNADSVLVGGGTWVFSTKLTCVDNPPVYEGDVDFNLDCSLTWDRRGTGIIEKRPDYGYTWSPRGDTPDTSLLIAGTAGITPTFGVPDNVDVHTDYEYRLTVSGRGGRVVHEADVTVTVLNKEPLSVACTPPDSVYEGSADIAFDCEASGGPAGSAYAYAWAASGDTQDTSLLSAADIASPTFRVPDEVDENETYEYLLTVSAENAEDATAEVMVRVLNKPAIVIICLGNPYEPYEWDDVFDLDCVASGAPAGSEYVYVWTGRGSTPNTDRLIAGTDGPTPTFDVPNDVDSIETYKYTLAVSAENAEPATEDITVTVRNESEITVTCTPPSYMIFEGEDDFDLNCSVTNEPSDATYSWTGTDIANRISSTTILTPTFKVPGEVDATTTYEYTLTVSAEGVEDGVARVTVTVKDKPEITVTCTGNPYEKYEGEEDFALNCSARGAPGGSNYAYLWEARGDTPDTALLSAADIASPTFRVPDEVDENETYEYLLTASAENAESGSAEVTVTVLNGGALAVVCADPGSVYEGSADITFDCEASGAPSGSGYTYAWTPRGDTPDTALLSATDISSPVFYVPGAVDATTTYEYRLTVSAAAESSSARVTVTVLNRRALAVVCADPGSVYEDSEDIAFDCEASGAPAGSTYEYEWTPRGDTPDTALLSAADIASPTFYVPNEVDETTTYEYLLTASAENAESGSAEVTVTVLNEGTLTVACTGPSSVYEGSADITFDCEASGAPSGSGYTYAWTPRGNTQDTALLSAADIASPTFYVPNEVDETTTYEYLLTASAENAESGSAEVTVTVLNEGTLTVACTGPSSVYEGSADITFDCEASGAPSGSGYTYAWTPRGNTQDTALLSATDIASPTFYVPNEVDETTTYEYLLTASAENAESGSAEVSVTVLNEGTLTVACTGPSSVYEGSEDIAFDCEASGAPAGSTYEYVWTPRGNTQDTALLIAGTDGPTPTFDVPEDVDATTTYEYTLTVSAEDAESGSADVAVTVLNKPALAVVCADPRSAYEGSEDITFDCSASGAPGDNPQYTYTWTASGDTPDTALLNATDVASPTFLVPEEEDATTIYEYRLTVSAANAEDATAEVSVTVLNKGALAVVCTYPGSAYEGSEDITFDCSASGAPGDNPEYTYAWMASGDTQDTALLNATDVASPTFHVPEEVDEDETYGYLLTVSAANAEEGSAEVTVTVLNKGALALVCADPGSAYEGSDDIVFDCSASGAPGDNPQYTYVWTAQGDTPDVSLLSAADVASPTFAVPEEIDEDETYEYLLTVSAANAEDASSEVMVTVLDRIKTPDPDPVSPPLASSSAREPSEPSSLGVTISASSLRFGMQSADTQVSLDPMTDQISTHVSGPYHGGRMTLAPGGSEAIDENGEMDLSIELASPVVLRREGGIKAASIVLTPSWSLAESCEQLSSQTIGGLYTEVTLSEEACRLLLFGGELDLTGVPSGRYAGSLDIILRSGESEETHTVDVDVTVIPAQRVITIGPRGVRFSTSRELPVGLTEEQNLSIYPDVAFLTEEKPHGVFELSNPSLIPLEVSVSARFGYTEATENGREVVVEDVSGSHLGDLSQVVDIHPGVLVLMPGEKGLVRYGMQEGALAAMAEKGYAAFFDVVSEPRQYVRSDQMPEEVTGDRTARVTMRVPGVYVPGEGASQLRAALLSISYVGSLSATFLVETQDHPFAGEVVAYDGDGHELGRRETLVYTRSRVRISLDRMPEEGAVFLRFMPRGSGRAPEPASVEWDAPRRDIGAADKDRTRTPATLVQKP